MSYIYIFYYHENNKSYHKEPNINPYRLHTTSYDFIAVKQRQSSFNKLTNKLYVILLKTI